MDLIDWIGIITVFSTVIGGIIVLVIKGTRILGRLESRQDILEETMEVVQVDIKELMAKDNAMNIQLVDINVTLNRVDTMTTKIYDHFFDEGIKNKEKSDGSK